MRSANRLLQRCRLSAVASARAIGGHWRAAPLICKPPAVWLESSRTTHADSAVPPAGGPLAVYTRGVASGKYRADPQQLDAVRKLQRVWDELDAADGLAEERGGSGLTLVDSIGGSSTWSLWNRIAKKLEVAPPPSLIRGLYLFGGVGTGKTMLMDIFSDSLGHGTRKKRIHFLDFMLDVHRRLRHLKNVADPLHAVAQEFTSMHKPGGGRLVLCLDEFMVTDVADAMILKRLFQHLFDFGLVMVSTSNRAPDRLYEGGLQRPLFMPFIALLKTCCEVHDIQGSQDYRRLARRLSQSLYFTGPGAAVELQTCMELFAPGATPAPAVVQAVAAADFIALCESYHTILLEGVPVLDASTRAAAYRLVALVDVVYEQRARLICAAEGSPAQLFEGIVTHSEFQDAKARLSAEAVERLCVDDNVGFAKERCVSRLLEMSSIHYARQHAARHAPELLPSLPPEEHAAV